MGLRSFVTATVIGACACAGTTASAEVIDFNGMFSVSDPVHVDGYSFRYLNRNGWAIGKPGGTIMGDFNNGTEAIAILDQVDRDMTIRMTHQGGELFDLLSFEVADLYTAAAGQMNIVVTGYYENGDIVTTSLSTSSTMYTSHLMPSTFVDLTAVEWHGTGVDGTQAVGFALDNINAIPEPASLGLLGAAALLLRRRR